MGRKLINEIGNRYGLLIVIDKTKDKNNKTIWVCKCDCGNLKNVRGSDLRNNKISCCGPGCPLKFTRNANFKDLTGLRFGKLIVISFKCINNNHKSVWHCKCDCGNECDILGAHLINGSTKSCGCLHRIKMQNLLSNDLIGKQFGKLTVIKKTYNKNQHLMWQCKCQCGNIINVYGKDLTSNNVQSCGCIQSSYEMKIYDILKKLKINFKKEQSFPDLISQKKRRLRYDFSIIKNNKIIGLIEFQGDQHFKPIEHFGGEQEFKKRQLHDKMKYEYAIKNNLPLLYLTKDDNLEMKIKQFLNEVEYNEV